MNRSLLDKLAEIDPGMPLSAVRIFCLLAATPDGPMPLRKIADRLEIAPRVATRMVWSMSHTPYADRRQHGYGLVEVYDDPTDGRHRLVRLTNLGREIARLAQKQRG